MAVPIRPASAFRLLLAAAAVLAVAVTAGLLSRGPTPASANPLGGVVAVDAGARHTCALLSDGGVKCWGWNFGGQLGNGTTVNSLVPVDVVALAGAATALSVGDNHACVLTSSAGVECWGANSDGQVADMPPGAVTISLAVPGVSNVVAVGAGSQDTCVATGTGSVMCWGAHYGAPAVVPLLTSIVDVTAGGTHACGLTTTGAAKCWGENYSGQLGGGTMSSWGQLDVVGLSAGVQQISAGVEYTCAVTAVGGAKCWGDNTHSQLGDGTNTRWLTPVDVTGLTSGVAAVSAGITRTCALLDSGGVKCWGDGFGAVPVDAPGLETGITNVSVGSDHVCAVTVAGGVKCLGTNVFGQLGNGTALGSDTAVDVALSQVKPTATATTCPGGVCPTATPSPADCPGVVCMKLRVIEGAISCPEDASGPRVCIPLGAKFKLRVDVVRAPATGYIVVQTYIEFGVYHPEASEDGAGPNTCSDNMLNGLEDSYDRYDADCVTVELAYKKAPAPLQEALWPDLGYWLRNQLGPGLVGHSGVTGVTSLPVSNYVGPVVQVSMNCGETPSSTDAALLPLSPQNGNGSGFVAPDGQTQLPASDELTVDCVLPPTPTVTPTPLPLGGAGAFPDVAGEGGVPLASLLAGAAAPALLLAGLAWRVRAARAGGSSTDS